MSITNTIDNLVRDTSKLFQYDFYVSKDYNGTTALTSTTTAGYKLKTDAASTALTKLSGIGKYIYEFSSLGSTHSTTHSDSYFIDELYGLPTRTYASQILTEIVAADFSSTGNVLPIFIMNDTNFFNDHLGVASNNSLVISKIQIKFEIYKWDSTNGNLYNVETKNLFKLVVSQNSASTNSAVSTFPKTLSTQTDQPDKNTTVISGTFSSINDKLGFNLTKLNDTEKQKKQVINYEVDLNHHVTDITKANNIIVGLQFNSDITPDPFLECNIKITSHVTIVDNLKAPQNDKY